MKMKLMNQLLQARDTLNAISQASFTFATLNKRFPISELDDSQASELLENYRPLIAKVKKLVVEYENENGGDYEKAR